MDLSTLKIDILDPSQFHLFQTPETWETPQLASFATALRSRNIKGVVVVGEVTVFKLTEIFKNTPAEKQIEILEALGQAQFNPKDFEQTK